VSDQFTPADAWRGFWRWLSVGVGALVVIGLVILAGAHFGWWLQNQDATHQNQIIQNGVSNQETLRAEITSKIGDVEQMTVQIDNPAYAAERADIEQSRYIAAQLVCGDAAEITGVPLRPAENSWVLTNCLDGNVKATSPYYVNGAAGS
jgi:hypothetical protein